MKREFTCIPESEAEAAARRLEEIDEAYNRRVIDILKQLGKYKDDEKVGHKEDSN